MFFDARHIPNLDLTGPIAAAEAQQLFLEILTATLDQAVAERGHIASWTLRDHGNVTRFVVQGFHEREVRELWAAAVYAASMAAGNPGVTISDPVFRGSTGMNRKTGQSIAEVHIDCWLGGLLMPADGRSLPPARFSSDRAPGYLDLIERYGTELYYAEGYLWRACGTTLEGFRLGGLPLFQGAEDQAVLTPRVGHQHTHDLTAPLDLSQPMLLNSPHAGVVHERQMGLDSAARFFTRRSTYDCQDLVLCLFEAFHRQRDAWVTEHVQIPNGQKLSITPWRLLCLDPHELRARLDPRQTWGANWRSRLFDRLITLTMLERQTRSRTGQVIDAGDRLVRRVLDGRRALHDGDQLDAGIGLVSTLHRAGALPVDAFLVEISVDFMARLMTWATDERGIIHWGSAAADAAERAALATQPEDRQRARRVRTQIRQEARAQPYYLHSPRLLTLGNLERWSVRRKWLAYALLQERTPPRKSRRDTRKHTRRRQQRNPQRGREVLVRFNGQDYVGCNGSRGHGYRVAIWIEKAGHDGHRSLRAFLADLTALQRSLDLRLELRASGRQSTGNSVWDGEALTVLEAYGRTPGLAGDFRLKIYLPVDLETQLRARLAAVGIEAVDDGEERASLLQPRGGPSPADLRLARQHAGWTQSELARRLGVTKVTISQWECGKKPIPATRLPRLRVMVARCWAVFNRQRTVGLSPKAAVPA